LFASANLAAKFPELPSAPFTWTRAGFEREIGFGGFEHLAGALFAFSAKTRPVGTIAFVVKAKPKSGRERIP